MELMIGACILFVIILVAMVVFKKSQGVYPRDGYRKGEKGYQRKVEPEHDLRKESELEREERMRRRKKHDPNSEPMVKNKVYTTSKPIHYPDGSGYFGEIMNSKKHGHGVYKL